LQQVQVLDQQVAAVADLGSGLIRARTLASDTSSGLLPLSLAWRGA